MHAIAEAHPNIALIKYWGKAALPGNVPAVPSLSVTLGGLATRTEVTPSATDADEIVLNGERRDDPRIAACLDRFRRRAGSSQRLRVATTNSFPTAAGLASSASGFAALVGALDGLFGLNLDAAELSREARCASASAARSIHGGIVSLTGDPGRPESWYGRVLAEPTDWPLEVVVAICSSTPKSIASREGMQASAATSPYYDAWVAGAAADYDAGVQAVAARDFDALARVGESSCLKMHAVMLSTVPALLYWNGATLACVDAVRALRAEGVPVFFTIDAGPQVKAVCLPAAAPAVAAALGAIDTVLETLRCPVGGPMRILATDPRDGQHP